MRTRAGRGRSRGCGRARGGRWCPSRPLEAAVAAAAGGRRLVGGGRHEHPGRVVAEQPRRPCGRPSPSPAPPPASGTADRRCFPGSEPEHGPALRDRVERDEAQRRASGPTRSSWRRSRRPRSRRRRRSRSRARPPGLPAAVDPLQLDRGPPAAAARPAAPRSRMRGRTSRRRSSACGGFDRNGLKQPGGHALGRPRRPSGCPGPGASWLPLAT